MTASRTLLERPASRNGQVATVSGPLVSNRPRDRIVVVDALRGVCFCFMTMDHFPGDPFARFSNTNFGPFGLFTAALGFVFLSGVISGLVYERHRLSYGVRSMTRRVVRRIRDVYVTQMAIFLMLAAALIIGVGNVGQWHLDLISESPWRGLIFGSLLLYEPSYLGILPMYCLFLLMTPIALWAFQRGNSRYVLGASALVWMISGLAIGVPADPQGVDFGAFSPLGYQFLFVLGLAFGTKQLSIERLSLLARKWLLGSSAVVASACVILREQLAFDGPFNFLQDRLGNWFSVVQLGPLRLLSFAAFGVILYWICSKIEWERVQSRAFQLLAFVGRHSLPVFAWSILVTYAAVEFFPPHPDAEFGLLGVVVAVASLVIPAQAHAMIRQRQAPFRPRSIIDGLQVRITRRAA